MKEAVLMLNKHSILQRDEINRLSLQLRTAYYNDHVNEYEMYSTPYGGIMSESIGAWPEFILRGTFCRRSIQGLCSPCFYSRFPLSNTSPLDYLDMVKKQVSYVTDNFQKLVVECQYGEADASRKYASLVLTPTGSFFDEDEFPIGIRLTMEQALIRIVEEQGLDIFLHIESHCKDFVKYDFNDRRAEQEIALLKRLNARIIFGFESSNEYSRNVLYNKDLTLSDFELAINKAKAAGLSPGAFVFAGLFAYSDFQTHCDVMSTIRYLLDNSVFPVIMFQNDQPYTITDVLLKSKEISLLEPWTVAGIISDTVSLLEQKPSYWLIADPIGGPPEPDRHIFKESKLTCRCCSDKIYAALVDLRTTRDTNAFLTTCDEIKHCNCYREYKQHLDHLYTNSGFSRTDMLLRKCRQQLGSYLLAAGGEQ